MVEYLSAFLLAVGVVIMLAAIIMIGGFILSMPVAVVYAVKEHHEHQPPHPTLGDRMHSVHLHKPVMHMPKFQAPKMHRPEWTKRVSRH